MTNKVKCPNHTGDLIWLGGSTYFCIPNQMYANTGHEIDLSDLTSKESS